MEEVKIKITLHQLECMLNEQKQLTVKRLSGNSSYYNKNSKPSQSFTLDIDEQKMMQLGIESQYPNDFNVLKKYLTD